MPDTLPELLLRLWRYKGSRNNTQPEAAPWEVTAEGAAKIAIVDAYSNLIPNNTPSSGQILVGQSNGQYVPKTMSGDATIDSAGALTLTLNSLFGGRLTLTTGTPVTTSDVTGATTIYYTPYLHNRVPVYSGSAWTLRTFSELTLSLGTITSGRPYDVFLYNNSGTLTLEILAWSSTTARATALVRQDGVWVKNGDTTRVYLGTLQTTSTTATEDSKKSRLLINHYNRISRKLRAHDGSNSWTSSTNAFEAWNSGTTLGTGRVDALFPSPAGDNFARFSFGGASSNASTRLSSVGIGVDSTTVNSATKIIGAESTTLAPSYAFYSEYPSLGYHFFQMLQRPGNAGVTTFAGDGGVDYLFSSLEGEVWG